MLALAALAALAALIALAALLDLGPFAGSGGQLSKEEFVAKADSICADAHEQFASLQSSQPTTPAEAAVLTGKLLSISEDEFNALDALDVAPAIRPQLDRYLMARKRGIERIRDAYEAAKQADAAQRAHRQPAYLRATARYVRDRAAVARTQVQRLKLARALGLHECSRPLPELGAGG